MAEINNDTSQATDKAPAVFSRLFSKAFSGKVSAVNSTISSQNITGIPCKPSLTAGGVILLFIYITKREVPVSINQWLTGIF